MLSIKMQQKEDVDVQMLYMQQNFSNLLEAKEYDKNLEFLNNQFSIQTRIMENI